MEGGGDDHEWLGLNELSPWVSLPISLDGVRQGVCH